jgi:hypothetical protein
MPYSTTVMPLKNGKYSVVAYLREPFEDMIDSATHAAQYTHKANAQRKADEIVKHLRSGGFIDTKHWLWTPSVCSPYACFQVAPTAKPYAVNDVLPR